MKLSFTGKSRNNATGEYYDKYSEIKMDNLCWEIWSLATCWRRFKARYSWFGDFSGQQGSKGFGNTREWDRFLDWKSQSWKLHIPCTSSQAHGKYMTSFNFRLITSKMGIITSASQGRYHPYKVPGMNRHSEVMIPMKIMV